MKNHMKTAGAALVAGVVLLTGCSSGSQGEDTPSPAEKIVAAADASLLPYNFLDSDNTTWKGINVDLAAALSTKLGRPIVFENASFDTIIPGLASGRYDVALTGMFDTKEREKTVDFVDYLGAKNNFLMTTDIPDVSTMDDLCGYVVGIPSGALEADLLATASDDCKKAGKKEITVNQYADLDAVILALTSGRIQVTPNDSAANAYILAQHTDTLKVSGSYLTDGYFAAGFAKDSELTAEFKQAFADIIADGTYTEILTKWGVADRALKEPIINGAPF